MNGNDTMQGRFTDFIESNRLIRPRQKVLLAVSGGIDSMVLLHLFERSGFRYGVVHCNFKLRGEDSEKDEAFVRQCVTPSGVPFICRRFDTRGHARLKGISIEMAARELRYDFFEKVRAERNYDRIATAHHLDDLLETFFLNLSRKTGIRGLSGIKEQSGNIVRPLLFASRREIEEYARFHSVRYREDATNSEVVFQRNFIRHRIIPLFTELNPAFKENLAGTIAHLREAEEVYATGIRKARERVLVPREGGGTIHIKALREVPFAKVLLFEMLSGYNFNASVADQIYQGLDAGAGKQFFSKTHRLVKDREYLYIAPLPKEEENRVFYIEEGDMELFLPFDLAIEKIWRRDLEITENPRVAFLDYEKLQFPLLMRKWKQGDYFQPLGMSGFKKLSDFFIDEKMPLPEKENAWLLCSGQKIVWVMGRRIDNRFKVTPRTRQVVKIEMKS